MKKFLLIFSLFFLTTPVFADRVFMDGNELQTVVNNSTANGGAWDSMTNITSNTNSSFVRSGLASYQANISATTASAGLQIYSADSLLGQFYQESIYIVSAPSASTTIMQMKNTAGTVCASVKLGTDRTIQGLGTLNTNGTTRINTAISSALPLGTWETIDLRWNTGALATNGVLQVRLNGSIVGTFTGLGGQGTDPQNCSARDIFFGVIDTATANIYYDDFKINDDLSGSPSNPDTTEVSYPDYRSKVIHLRPNANGDATTCTVSAGSASIADAWDEIRPDDATSMCTFVNANDTVDENIDNYASTTIGTTANDKINVVEVGVRLAGATAGATGYNLRIKSQASGNVGVGLNPLSTVSASWFTHDDTVPRVYSLSTTTATQTGGAWTPSALNTTQIGLDATDATPDVLVSTMWLAVDFTPPRRRIITN